MPLDGQTYKPTVEFTLEDVLAWAKTRNPNETYNYQDCHSCVIARFLKTTGRTKEPDVGPYSWGEQGAYGSQAIRYEIDSNLIKAADTHPYSLKAFAERLEDAI